MIVTSSQGILWVRYPETMRQKLRWMSDQKLMLAYAVIGILVFFLIGRIYLMEIEPHELNPPLHNLFAALMSMSLPTALTVAFALGRRYLPLRRQDYIPLDRMHQLSALLQEEVPQEFVQDNWHKITLMIDLSKADKLLRCLENHSYLPTNRVTADYRSQLLQIDGQLAKQIRELHEGPPAKLPTKRYAWY